MTFLADSRELPSRLLLRVFLLLAAVDVIFILLNLGAYIGLDGTVPNRLNTFSETSVVSHYSYGKWAVIAVICALIWHRRGPALFGALATLFAFVLIDDMAMVHEKGGRRLMAALPWLPDLGLPRADAGELYVFGLMGLVLLALLADGFRRTDPVWRRRAAVFVPPFAMTVLFGVGLDALSALLRPGMNPDTMHHSMFVFNLVEETGEMIAASLATAWAVVLYRVHAAPMPVLARKAWPAGSAGGPDDRIPVRAGRI